jgi:hypothetical protein
MTGVSETFTADIAGWAWDGRRMTRVLLAIGSFLTISGSILIVSTWCHDILGFFGLGSLFLVTAMTWPYRLHTKVLLVAGLVAIVYGALHMENVTFRLAAVAWTFAALHVIETHASRRLREGPPTCWLFIHWAALGLVAVLGCWGLGDRLWFAVVAFNESIPASTPVGLWVSGLPVYAVGFLVVLTGHAASQSKRASLVACALLVCAWLLLRAFLGLWAPVTTLKVVVVQVVSLVLVSGVVAGLRPRRCVPARWWIISVALTLCILALGCLSHEPSSQELAATPRRAGVALYGQGLLDWRVPDAEHRGLLSSGMFGLLKRWLECEVASHGGQVMVADSLTGEVLREVGLVVFINPTRDLTPQESDTLEGFVRSGGGMLVLGDHTDIGGSRGPLNTILDFTGMRFRFDSAVPLRQHWHGCLWMRCHPILRRVGDEVMLQIAVGASLEIRRPATPVVMGRYGFCDHGDVRNFGRGANMGNVVHERDERLGDLVLVATEQVGSGRVVVFGDTSPFQNGAIFVSRRLVSNAISWARGVGGDMTYGDETAIIDFSLRPAANLEPFTEVSLGGLANCLARDGLFTVVAMDAADWSDEAGYIFLVAPTKPVGRAEASRLMDYMRSGGHVILCQGHRSKEPCDRLLSQVGLGIEHVPLGGGGSDSHVEHKEAWGITCSAGIDTVLLATAFGMPTIVARPCGRGTFTLIADGRMLLDENLEGERTASATNITFVNSLLEDLREGNIHAKAQHN